MSRTQSAAAVLISLFAAAQFATQPAHAVSSSIVISQVYGGGGNAGATLKNDFIELFNRGGAPVSLNGWSVQYASTAGTTWQKTNLTNVTLAPGQYYLVQEAAGTGGTTPLPTPDATGTIAMAAGAGKVVLVNNQTTIATGTVCPVDASIVDVVGYGSATNCFEGAGPTATITNTTAALRGGGGCTDTDQNGADFAAGGPNPRNTATPASPCSSGTNPTGVGRSSPSNVLTGYASLLTVAVTPGASPTSTGLAVTVNLSTVGGSTTTAFFDDGTHGDAVPNDHTFSLNYSVPEATAGGARSLPVTITDAQLRTGTTSIPLTLTTSMSTIAIHDIQGSGGTSPLLGQIVQTTGIVTGIRVLGGNGLFIQTDDADIDGDPATSEGVFVFTSSVAPAAATVGTRLAVQGTVTEFVPSGDPSSPPTTELTSPAFGLISAGNPLPSAIVLTGADTSPAGSIEQLERFEGMRVQVNSLTTIAPTDGATNEVNATGASNGIFYGVITGVPRPFREPGIEVPDPLPAGSPPGVPRFDANPERLRVDTTALSGGAALNVTSNVVLANVIGPLDYRVRTYTIDTDPASPPTATTPNMVAAPVRDATADEFTIASFNMERFFDTVDDAGSSDVALTTTAFNNRLSKASMAIRNILRSPDIIGVQEMEHLSTLQAVADRVNADAVAAGDPNPNYQAYLEEGNDIGGIDVGLLVKTPRVTVVDVTQFGKATTYVEPGGASALLNDRPPLVLRAIVNSETHPPYPVTVIVNHLRSLSGVDDPADGDRVRAKRRAQAEYLANLIQARQTADPTERIVSVGDYNAFQFNDGYVDSIGTIKGSPTAANEVVLASGDLVDPNLVDLVDFVPAGERYSFSFDGNAQELDHVLVTTGPQNSGRPVDLQYGRMDADFPEIYRSDPNRPERLSDHDPLVAYFSLNSPPVCATATAAASTFPPNHTMRAVVISDVTDPDQDAVTLTVTAICQDEPPSAQPSIFAVDGIGVGTASAAVRAEVTHPGDGRVYHIFFDADDGKGGVCSGEVKVNVPVSPKGTAIDSGPLFDSTSPNGAACVAVPK
jgi:predicted extracellular nuclease